MTKTNRTKAYPADVARAVSARRPDLAAHDAIAAVLTADPTLTADEVIAILDDATAEAQDGQDGLSSVPGHDPRRDAVYR